MQELQIAPISSIGDRLFQPVHMTKEEAQKTLNDLQKISSPFSNKIHYKGAIGVISLNENAKREENIEEAIACQE